LESDNGVEHVDFDKLSDPGSLLMEQGGERSFERRIGGRSVYQIGEAAANLILSHIEGDSPKTKNIAIDFQLKRRGSA
jgi:hypothetical protein